MISSMTGYGTAAGSSGNLTVTVELKSVNNRFLDASVRLPRLYSFAEEALKSGKTLYVPRCGPGRSMRAVRLAALDKLRPGALGIPEPVGDRESAGPGDIELALIPCVTATRDGRRLGHGAGYYDRFLAQHHCRKLCLCYEALLSAELPTDAHDVRMDAVVTENGLYTG